MTIDNFLYSIAESEKELFDEWIEDSIMWGENKYKTYWSIEAIVERLKRLQTQPVWTRI